MIANASARTPEFLFIPLTKGQFACVDFDAPAEVFSRKWHVFWDKRPKTYYAVSNQPRDAGVRRKLRMHRLIVGVTDRSIQVDHRNRNGLDNRRENLRACTQTQNMHNTRPIVRASKFKGVSWCNCRRKWRATMRVGGKQRELGRFESEEAAARAYDSAAIRCRGEFVYLNFPAGATQ